MKLLVLRASLPNSKTTTASAVDKSELAVSCASKVSTVAIAAGFAEVSLAETHTPFPPQIW